MSAVRAGGGSQARPGRLPTATGSRRPGGPDLAHPAARPPGCSVPATNDSSPVGLRWNCGLPRQCWWLTAREGGLGAGPLGLASQHHAPRGTINATGVVRQPAPGPRASGRASGSLLVALSSTPRSWRAEQAPAPVETEACSPQLCFQVVARAPRDRLGAGPSAEGGFPPWQCLHLQRRPRAPQRASPGPRSQRQSGQPVKP